MSSSKLDFNWKVWPFDFYRVIRTHTLVNMWEIDKWWGSPCKKKSLKVWKAGDIVDTLFCEDM